MKILRYTEACKRECLFYRLLDLLEEHGWFNLGLASWIKSRRVRVNGFQEVAYRILTQGGYIAPVDRIRGGIAQAIEHDGKVFRFILGRGDVKADAAYFYSDVERKPSIERCDLINMLPEKAIPLIVVDMSQLHLHNLDEAASLRRQLASILGVVREYLWDRHLVLTSAPEGVRGWLRSFIASFHVRITSLDTDDFLTLEGVDNCILLDPNVNDELTSDDVLSSDAFIVGGIVDKRPRPGATLKLRITRCRRRRIALRGSIVGVPNTINSIVDAILRARYLYNGSVERALYDVIPPHEARIRAFAELMRYTRGARGIEVDWSFYCELVKWLPLRPRDFEKVARMVGVRLKGRCECCDSAKTNIITDQR